VVGISSFLLYPMEPIEQEAGWAAEPVGSFSSAGWCGNHVCVLRLAQAAIFHAGVRCVKTVEEMTRCGDSDGDEFSFMCLNTMYLYII
jgi:hypothetical protein